MIKQTPSQDVLLDRLRYDELSGKLFWRPLLDGSIGAKCFNGKLAGKEAGTITDQNYVVVKLVGTPYLAHRLIWKMVTGQEVVRCIDHIDGNKHNNRLSNLRDVTLAQNSWNTGIKKGNNSGFKGVSFVPRLGKWRARIRIDGHQKYLGVFDTPELAHRAFVDATIANRDAYARNH